MERKKKMELTEGYNERSIVTYWKDLGRRLAKHFYSQQHNKKQSEDIKRIGNKIF